MKKILNIIEEHLPKRILVVGSGGGSDIFSSVIMGMELSLNPFVSSIDFAGMLSPASFHTYNGKFEKPVNRFNHQTDIKRYLQDKKQTEITFVDNHFCEIIHGLQKEHPYPFRNVYHLSCLYGTDRLRDEIGKLVDENKYDVVVVVDVGGDILAELNVNGVLSPMMDITCLHVFSALGIPTYIVEMGYGTDGENDNKTFDENVWHSPLETDELKYDHNLKKFERFIFTKMNRIRKGHTIPLLLQSIQSEEEQIVSTHKYTYRLGNWKMTDEFDVVLKKPYNKVYLFDLNCVEMASEVCDGYGHPIEQSMYFKSHINDHWASEIDFHTLTIGDNHVLFGCLSRKFPQEAREEAFLASLKYAGSLYDSAIYANQDIIDFGLNDFGFCEPINGDYSIIFRDVFSDVGKNIRKLLT